MKVDKSYYHLLLLRRRKKKNYGIEDIFPLVQILFADYGLGVLRHLTEYFILWLLRTRIALLYRH